MSLNPDSYSRIRLFGKRVSNLELARFIMAELRKKSKSELAAALNMSRPTLNQLVELAGQQGIQTKKEKKTLDEKWEGSRAEFVEIEEIKEWRTAMDMKRRGGKPFADSAKEHYITGLWQICETLNIHPKQIVYGDSPKEVLETGRKIMKAYFDLHQAGKAKHYNYSKRFKEGKADPAQAAYSISKYLRDFMKSQGYEYPIGESGLMSQAVTTFHGNYSTVRISEEIHQSIQANLKKKYGQDSDEWLYYAYGMEAFPREAALISTRTKNTVFTNKAGKRIMTTENIESKTSQYKKGVWVKYIFDEAIQEAILRRAKKGQEYLFQDRSPKWRAHIIEVLKEQYRAHDLDKLAHLDEGDPNTSYFIAHPNHCLRHAGAQRLLRATKWNIAFVASMGWKTAQELTDSYGEMPPEVKAEQLEEVNF